MAEASANMAQSMRSFSIFDFFVLGENFWLPRGVEWDDIRLSPNPGALRPLPVYLLLALALAFVLLLVRALLNRFVLRPFGRYFLINDRVVPPPVENVLGEKLHKQSKGNPSAADVEQLVRQTGWSQRQVERWFRQRRLSALPKKMVKFTDSSWRFIGYISLLILGLNVVPLKDYFYDVRLCWSTYPHRDIPVDEFIYYMLELAFYLSLTISHCFEQRKKDFWEMLIHHIATMGLIATSYLSGYTPIGALIMLCHDIADPWLELAKLIGYTRHKRELGSHYLKDKLTEGFFILFAGLFFVTRLFYFPVYLIHSVYAHAPLQFGPFPMNTLFLTLLCTLCLLHVFWTVLICKVISRSILSGHVKGDSRSDDEMTTDDDSGKDRSPSGSGSPKSLDHGSASRRHRANGGQSNGTPAEQ